MAIEIMADDIQQVGDILVSPAAAVVDPYGARGSKAVTIKRFTYRLTLRQLQIAVGMCGGMSTNQIADVLGLCPATVMGEKDQLMQATGTTRAWEFAVKVNSAHADALSQPAPAKSPHRGKRPKRGPERTIEDQNAAIFRKTLAPRAPAPSCDIMNA